MITKESGVGDRSMYQFERIKLVIWDLDDTFWQGTLSEGNITIPEAHKEIISVLADAGIISSICSKNDWLSVKSVLDAHGLTDYFVFPSVNWEAKGARVKQIIEDMKLRAENVLFVDDNPSNIGEVEYHCKGIMTADPKMLPQLLAEAKQTKKTDTEHKRLEQYRLLESKREARGLSASNEEFLFNSNISLQIHHDCMEQLGRIHELVKRTNQLNFTKCRSSEKELEKLLETPSVTAGYVTVEDKFGDYGIVGFYAMQNGALIHFLFSCRTLGMGIEQYVYNYLNRPTLTIVGDVISDLSDKELPSWINQGNKQSQIESAVIKVQQEHRILIKGPCDLYQIFPYIANREQFDTDFSRITDSGIPLESTSHTTHMVEALRLTQQQKQRVADEVPFVAAEMYCDDMYRKGYRVVVLSILQDANLGVYQNKKTGERLAFLEYNHPLTEPECWDALISGEYYNAGFRLDREMLRVFSENYAYLGRNTPENIVENLQFIRENLPDDCLLMVMLGGELPYEKNTIPAYADRHLIHQKINAKIREWAGKASGVCLLDVNKHLVDQSSFYDHFNHYVKPVYYNLACEMVEVINRHIGCKIRNSSKLKIAVIRAKEILATAYIAIKRIFRKKR